MPQEKIRQSYDYHFDIPEGCFRFSEVTEIMSLQLSDGKGQESGYPRVNFSVHGDVVTLNATDLVRKEEGWREVWREPTIGEIRTLVQVTRRLIPDEEMTNELIKKAQSELEMRRTFLLHEVNTINQALEMISPPQSV
jgi:hypothetical protein